MEKTEKTVQDLFDFIDEATKNRKYSPDVATSLRVALKLIQNELSEEEQNSLEVFKDRLDQIFNTSYAKNKNRISAASFERYKGRVRQIIRDFENYANNPTKMAAWNPAIRTQKKATTTYRANVTGLFQTKKYEETHKEMEENTGNGEMIKFELPLRPNVKAIILTPPDLTTGEAKKIKVYIESLEKLAELNS